MGLAAHLLEVVWLAADFRAGSPEIRRKCMPKSQITRGWTEPDSSSALAVVAVGLVVNCDLVSFSELVFSPLDR